MAPVTLHIGAAADPADLSLPAPQAGGEIFAVLRAKGFLPDAVHLVGANVNAALKVQPGGIIGMTGLPPGSYALTPIYRGTRAPDSTPIQIRAMTTTDLAPWSLPTIGGVHVLTDIALCSAQSTLTMRYVTGDSRQTSVGLPVAVRDATGACEWSLSGLQEGRLVIQLLDASNAVKDTAEADIHGGVITDVMLAPGRIMVEGHLTRLKKAADGRSLQFRQQGTSGDPLEVTTDANGDFQLALPAEGTYRIQLMATKYLPLMGRTEKFKEGQNTLDWEIPGGALKLIITDIPLNEKSVAIQVQVAGAQPFSGVLFSQPNEVVLDQDLIGVPLGTYSASAQMKPDLTSDLVAASLDEKGPDATAALRLHQGGGLVQLSDEQGTAITGATLILGALGLKEQGAGLYKVPAMPDGSVLRTRASGYVPSCRVYRRDPDAPFPVLMHSGTNAIKFISPAHIAFLAGSLSGIPDTDCPVAISMFVTSISQTATGTEITVSGLPSGAFQYIPATAGQSLAVRVPGPDVLIRGK